MPPCLTFVVVCGLGCAYLLCCIWGHGLKWETGRRGRSKRGQSYCSQLWPRKSTHAPPPRLLICDYSFLPHLPDSLCSVPLVPLEIFIPIYWRSFSFIRLCSAAVSKIQFFFSIKSPPNSRSTAPLRPFKGPNRNRCYRTYSLPRYIYIT